MGLNDPWADSLVIVALHRVKNMGINPMGRSAPW